MNGELYRRPRQRHDELYEKLNTKEGEKELYRLARQYRGKGRGA